MTHFCRAIVLWRKILIRGSSLEFFKCSNKSWSIVFFGSDNFSLCSLKELHKQTERKLIKRLEIVVVNEKTPVYKYAVSNAFVTHIWPPNLNGAFDFGVIVSFGKLIPKNIIELFFLGIFNVHASLLPKYRGGMPVVHAVKNGETVTGVTVTRIVPHKFDAGEIILQKACFIGENELIPSLNRRLSVIASECLLQVINTMPECLKNSFPQSEKDASYAPKLSKEAAFVNWDDMTAKEIFNLHRALFGMFDLMTTWKGQPVKLLCLTLNNLHFSHSENLNREKLQSGSFIYDKKSKFLYVQCKDKPIAVCTIAFKLKMYRASDFYTGFLHKIQRNLWKFGK